jgi:hypothetical protein
MSAGDEGRRALIAAEWQQPSQRWRRDITTNTTFHVAGLTRPPYQG